MVTMEDPEREVPPPIKKEQPEVQVESEEVQGEGFESKEEQQVEGKAQTSIVRKGYNSR